MTTLYIVLLALAGVCFLLGAANFTATTNDRRSVNFVALGLLFWVLVPLTEQIRAA